LHKIDSKNAGLVHRSLGEVWLARLGTPRILFGKVYNKKLLRAYFFK